MFKKVTIEIQHFEGCPNGPTMIGNVRKAIEGLETYIDYQETLVESNNVAAEIGFRGSPTLLINGEDFEGIPEPVNPAMTCRFYANGVPAPDEIKRKIRKFI